MIATTINQTFTLSSRDETIQKNCVENLSFSGKIIVEEGGMCNA